MSICWYTLRVIRPNNVRVLSLVYGVDSYLFL